MMSLSDDKTGTAKKHEIKAFIPKYPSHYKCYSRYNVDHCGSKRCRSVFHPQEIQVLINNRPKYMKLEDYIGYIWRGGKEFIWKLKFAVCLIICCLLKYQKMIVGDKKTKGYLTSCSYQYKPNHVLK